MALLQLLGPLLQHENELSNELHVCGGGATATHSLISL